MTDRRRDPISRERYRAVARGAGVRRPDRPRVLDGALVVAVAFAALVALPQVAGGVGSGLGQLAESVQATVPLLQGRAAIELPAGGSTSVGAAPVVDALPAYTRDPQLQLTGRIPAFAVQPGRTLQIVLNGAVIATKPVDQNGAFNAALALKEGTNMIGITLIADRDVVAASTHTVVLDRTPPKLDIAQPRHGSSVDARNVIVNGATEAGATITVNGRTVVTMPDGTFTDSFSASAGPLEIAVVSRDRAGNETTSKVTAIAQQSGSTAAATLSIAVTPATVRPGQQVVAAILLRDVTGPRVGVQVTLSVGVVVIGSALTDNLGSARIAFAAPTTEGDIGVVVLGGGTSGRATLTVTR